jgi:hypothetical protein
MIRLEESRESDWRVGPRNLRSDDRRLAQVHRVTPPGVEGDTAESPAFPGHPTRQGPWTSTVHIVLRRIDGERSHGPVAARGNDHKGDIHDGPESRRA